MDVLFERTGERRYAVRVERSDHPTLHMDPAPGYDPLLPHDLIHFVVEQELGLELGVFGQLAAGGDASSFRLPASSSALRERSRAQRRSRKRGARLARIGRSEAELSERAASSVTPSGWRALRSRPTARRQARWGSRWCCAGRTDPRVLGGRSGQ